MWWPCTIHWILYWETIECRINQTEGDGFDNIWNYWPVATDLLLLLLVDSPNRIFFYPLTRSHTQHTHTVQQMQAKDFMYTFYINLNKKYRNQMNVKCKRIIQYARDNNERMNQRKSKRFCVMSKRDRK